MQSEFTCIERINASATSNISVVVAENNQYADCLCKLIVWSASIHGFLKGINIPYEDVEEFLDNLLSLLFRFANIDYIPLIPYFSSRKKHWLPKLVEGLGEQFLEELLRALIHSKDSCIEYLSYFKEVLGIVMDELEVEEESANRILRIVDSDCYKLRSAIAYLLAIKPFPENS